MPFCPFAAIEPFDESTALPPAKRPLEELPKIWSDFVQRVSFTMKLVKDLLGSIK